jgi:hypothetical protein
MFSKSNRSLQANVRLGDEWRENKSPGGINTKNVGTIPRRGLDRAGRGGPPAGAGQNNDKACGAGRLRA